MLFFQNLSRLTITFHRSVVGRFEVLGKESFVFAILQIASLLDKKEG